MKPPQDRSTAVRIDGRPFGRPTIILDGNDEYVVAYEAVESGRGAATFRGEEEIRMLRDFCDAWLDHHAAGEGER